MKPHNRTFLGKSFNRYIALIVFATTMLIADKFLNYRYMVVQKAVQEGMVDENWHKYLELAGMTIGISVILRLVKVFFIMWTEKVQKVNFFNDYNGVLQEDGKREPALKILMIASAKLNCVIESIDTMINILYIIALMEIVTMTLPECIGAVSILLAGIIFGVLRGNLQAKTDMLGTETQVLQQKLSHSFMISHIVLDERLRDIEKSYWKRIMLQCIKNTIQVLPDVVKVFAFVALFYNITSLGMEEGKIYSYSYVLYTTYGYMVALASSMSNLLEYIFKISTYKRDRDVQEIMLEMQRNKEERATNREYVPLNDEVGMTVKTSFSIRLIRPNGEEAYYKVPEELSIKEGTAILLEGENGTGKSRGCKFFKSVIGNQCYAYDRQTSIVELYHENFRRGKSTIDFNLIKYIAKGLALERIPETKEAFFELKCSQLNSADMQMLIALQILYFVIKDYEEGKKSLVIFDEIFSNLSFERIKIVLPFIMTELAKCKACTIIVSHAYKDEMKKHVSCIWNMRNDEKLVMIEAVNV